MNMNISSSRLCSNHPSQISSSLRMDGFIFKRCPKRMMLLVPLALLILPNLRTSLIASKFAVLYDDSLPWIAESFTTTGHSGTAPDRILPTFPEFHDFRLHGPRSRRARADIERPQPIVSNYFAVHVSTTSVSSAQFEKDLVVNDTRFCRETDVTRAYAAAWLTTTHTMFRSRYMEESELHSKEKNLEFGFFVAAKKNKVYTTIDMFDFFVHHLSNYAKIQGRRVGTLPTMISEAMRRVVEMAEGYRRYGYNNPSRRRADNVLAILPYYSLSKHQRLPSNALGRTYLNVTVFSLANVFPNIVIYTATEEDFEYVTNTSGLNQYLYDVRLVNNLPSPTSLPFATSVRTRTLLLNGTYNPSEFEFVYYTESDQLLHLRDPRAMLQHAANANHTIVVPHRGQPYPTWDDYEEKNMTYRPMAQFLNQSTDLPMYNVPNLLEASCCFANPCQPAQEDPRKTGFVDVHLFRQHDSFAHVMGTGNVFLEKYMLCNFTNYRSPC